MTGPGASGPLAGLSIVMPVLEEAAGIEATLASLQAWREAGVEVVVVDGGSCDETPALAAPLADRVLRAPRGRAAQMNAGARVATGRLLLFLHADTALPAQAMSALDRVLAGSSPGWGRFDVAIDGQHWVLPIVAGLMNLRSALTGITTGDQAMFVSRPLFVRAGGFPEIPLMEDIELARALRVFAWPLRLRVKARTSGRRWEQRGPLRTVLLMWALRLLHYAGVDPARLARWYAAVR